MCAQLSTDLKQKYGVRSLPVRKDDRVKIVRGTKKGEEGKVVSCYRRRFVIHLDGLKREKSNGQSVAYPVDPSKVQLVQLKMDKNRKEKIEIKKAAVEKRHPEKKTAETE